MLASLVEERKSLYSVPPAFKKKEYVYFIHLPNEHLCPQVLVATTPHQFSARQTLKA